MPTFCFTRNYKLLLLSVILLFIDCLTITAQLTADFTIDKIGGCAPLSVSFTNTTTGTSANAIYSWNFGNGNTSSFANAGAIYVDEKTYDITLTVKDGNLSSSTTKQVTVYTPPQVDFTASPLKECLPVIVSFTSTALSGGNTYTWDFGDGNTQQEYNSSTTHTYGVAQTATVSLTVSNSYGCTKTVQKENLIEILPPINAAFSADKTFLCRITDAVQFSNTSFGPGTLTYLWDFGDNTTSKLATPSHVFNLKGTFNVTLIVTSSEGCTATSIQNGYINVDNFTSDFTVPSPICLGVNNNFTSTSNPATSTSDWFVDGINAYYYYYNNLNYNFLTTGQHTIELKNTFGTCRDSVIKKIIVNEVPILQGFIAEKKSDCGAPVLYNFKDTTASAVKWEWNFNLYNSTDIQSTIPAPSYTFTNDGDHYTWLRVTNAVGCTALTTKYIGVSSPYVYITAEGIPAACDTFSLKFSANSVDPISSYNWNFGDGTNSIATQPTHLFSKPGTWGIVLSYTTATGCKGNTSYGNVTVYEKPIADFTGATSACGNTPVTFNAVPHAGNYYYYWDYGDDTQSPSFGSSTTHQYTFDSTYSVRLITVNPAGCRDTMTKNSYIKVLPPFPKITQYENTCDGTRGLVTFGQESKKAESWTWDFGDQITKTLNVDNPTITHNYTNTGTYKTVLINTNGQCTVRDSIITKVLLKQAPLLTANVSQVCENETVHININNLQNNPQHVSFENDYNFNTIEYNGGVPFNGSVTKDYDMNNYLWTTSFDGSLGFIEKGHTSLRVILRSTNFQCLDTTNFIPLDVKGSLAGFEIITDNVCFKLPVVFKDTSKTNNKIVSWQWNFGDGNYQTFTQGGLVKHTYANPGNYYASLSVIDASGCSTSTPCSIHLVTVNGPKAAFYPSSNNTYITLPVYFYNNTNNFNSNDTKYKWKFGDGATSADFSPSYAYKKPGQYPVELIAYNPLTGCTDTTLQIITVNNFLPAFSITSSYLTGIGCPPLLVKMTNNSYNYTSVKWDFGDGTSADNLNYASHIYELPGKYIITLYVYGPGGLTGTFIDSVSIALPKGSIKTNKKEGCIGLTPTFTINTKNATTYLWDYGDGTVVANSNTTTSHQYNQPGKYTPLLMLIDSNGCSSFAPLADIINIHANPVVVIVPQDPRICKGKEITMVASGGTVYSWLPVSGLSNAFIANPKANPAVTTNYIVTVKDNIGCSNTSVQKITVVQPGKVNAGLDIAVCVGKTVQLNATGATFYQWIFSTNGLNNTTIKNPIASPLQTSTYTVTGTDQYKCFSDTASITIKVFALPTVSVLPLPEILLGTQIPLTSITSNDVIAWDWSPTDYLNCNNCPNPISTPLSQKTYTLTVTNSNGCTAKDAVILKLQCYENRVFIPGAFSPNGDGKNDVFSIMGISVVKHLVIYSRWGTPVYERHNYIASIRPSGWDGTYKGEPLPAGTYAYFTEMECPSGGTFTRKGTVVLVR